MAETAAYPTESLLAVDIGTVTTRAALFDVVEGSYRFLACGEAPSTWGPPFHDVQEGMRHALQQLQAVTGRMLVSDRAQLILPTAPDGSGVDALAASASGGPPLRALLIGLLPDVSVESALRVAQAGYLQVADIFSLGDRRRDEQQFDAVLHARPDVIIIAGGTDNGAAEALLKKLETVALACHLLPQNTQTKVLFIGNTAIKDKVSELLSAAAGVHAAPNVQPELGEPVLAPARRELASIYSELKAMRISGFHELALMSGDRVWPTALAAGQTLRYLSGMIKGGGSVLGVDVGAGATALLAAIKGDLQLDVRPDLGLGASALGVLAEAPVEQILRWLPFEYSERQLRDFVWNKAAHPRSIPADTNDLYLELALARQAVRSVLRQARLHWPDSLRSTQGELLPWFDLVVGTGAVFSHAPRPGVAAMLLLDALLPTAITTLFLDPHHLLAGLGAVAMHNPLAVVQSIESGAFLNLGMAISVVGRGRPGQVVAQARLVADGVDQKLDIKFGTLHSLPLGVGQEAKLNLRPRPGFDIGFGPGRGKTIPVLGGAVGVIIDARGRPIALPTDTAKRHAALQQWLADSGGMGV